MGTVQDGTPDGPKLHSIIVDPRDPRHLYLAMSGGGLWLLMLGGSPYYIVSGIAYVVSSVLLWRRRPTGAWLAVAVFAATVAWALWEVGFNYWALFPRVLLPAGLAPSPQPKMKASDNTDKPKQSRFMEFLRSGCQRIMKNILRIDIH